MRRRTERRAGAAALEGRQSDKQSGEDQAGRHRQAARRIEADSTSVRLASNVLENPVMMQPSKSRNIKWTCLQPWGPIRMEEAAARVARAGKCGSHAQDWHGYNYAWHEVMRGLETIPRQSSGLSSQTPGSKRRRRRRPRRACLERWGGQDHTEIDPQGEKTKQSAVRRAKWHPQSAARQRHRLHTASHRTDSERDVWSAAAVSQFPDPGRCKAGGGVCVQGTQV